MDGPVSRLSRLLGRSLACRLVVAGVILDRLRTIGCGIATQNSRRQKRKGGDGQNHGEHDLAGSALRA